MTEHRQEPQELLLDRIDWRTLGIMLAAGAVGVLWAIYNYSDVGLARGVEYLRPLVWVIFATPFALFLGWVVARPREIWLAAFSAFCFYFFTPFVGARIESLLLTTEQMSATNHDTYFHAVIWLHALGVVGFTLWRALRPVAGSEETEPGAQPDLKPSQEHA
jgi:hypothetical protein